MELLNTEWVYRDHTINGYYSALDEAYIFTITTEDGKGHAYDEAISVDEMLEAINDLIHVLSDQNWGDHEDKLINQARMQELEEEYGDELYDRIQEKLIEHVEDHEAHDHSYYSYKGYQAEVVYRPEEQVFWAICDGVAQVSARSLKSLWHNYQIAVDQYFKRAIHGIQS
jgi:hypothetical protein